MDVKQDDPSVMDADIRFALSILAAAFDATITWNAVHFKEPVDPQMRTIDLLVTQEQSDRLDRATSTE